MTMCFEPCLIVLTIFAESPKKPEDNSVYDYIPEGKHFSMGITLETNPAYDNTLKKSTQTIILCVCV